MQLKVSLVIILIWTIVTVNGSIESSVNQYEGYKVYEIIPTTEDQLKVLKELIDDVDNITEIDIWKWTRNVDDPLHVMVAPSHQQSFEQRFVEEDISATPFITNLAASYRQIDFNVPTLIQDYDFKSFLQYHEILQYLDAMQTKYPTKVKVEEVGKSFEGRPIKTIRISSNPDVPSKKTIFIDAGIHAREWIAPATALYIVDQLLTNESLNRDLVLGCDWIILPSVNPDGYQHTHEKNRLWRKTRKPGKNCIGTDANRNFGYHWGGTGASESECSERYRGTAAFSEPETTIVKQILDTVVETCKFYLTLHAYGNYLMYPWSYREKLPDNYKDLDDVCRAGAEAMRNSTGSTYTVGSSAIVLYPAAGASTDYALATIGVKISIAMELSGGKGGFIVSPEKILPIVSESWTGIAAMARRVLFYH